MTEYKVNLPEPPKGFRYKVDSKGCIELREPKAGEWFIYPTRPGAFLAIDEEFSLSSWGMCPILEKAPRWRAEPYGIYYYVSSTLCVMEDSEQSFSADNIRYEVGNYFQTRFEALEYSNKIKDLIQNRE